MVFSSLLALSPLEGRYAEKVDDLRPIFSEYGLIRFRVMIEIRWLQWLAAEANLPELPRFSSHAMTLLDAIIDNFSENDAVRIKQIESNINHDVKAVEYFIKENIADNDELLKIVEFIHFGCTSEDINNLAYALMLDQARHSVILPKLDELIAVLKGLSHQYAFLPMLSHTHGQAATPTTVGKEIANIVVRLQRQREQLVHAPILGKLNGASGNYNAMYVTYPNVDWPLLSKTFVHQLGIDWNPYTTQIEPHDFLSEWFSILIRTNIILIDFARDMWGYIALNYFQLKVFHNEVGSSAMPHKVNPIDFENAEGNFGIANALLEHMVFKLPISRWQRDLSDSTVLRNIGVAIGYAMLGLQSLCKGLGKVDPNPDALKADLDQHWEVLAEPIQTVLRRFGIVKPYEKLKEFTRGHPITETSLHEFIQQLALSDAAKQELLKLTPSTYIGYAGELAKKLPE